MKNKTYLAILFAIASSAIAFGQGPTPPTPAQMVANRVARLTTLLSLNSTQQATVTSALNTEEAAIANLHASMMTARKALETAVEADDLSGITTAATQIGTLTGQELAARSTADATIYAALAADQQAKFKQLQGPGGGPGPGGPGGHGGPPPPPPPANQN